MTNSSGELKVTIGTIEGMRRISAALLACAALQAIGCIAAADPASVSDKDSGEWRYFGGSKHFDRYSPLSQINGDSVGRLGVAWTRPGLDASLIRQFPDLSPSNYLHGTPIMIEGVLYASNAVGLNGAQLGQYSIESAAALNDIKLELSAKSHGSGLKFRLP